MAGFRSWEASLSDSVEAGPPHRAAQFLGSLILMRHVVFAISIAIYVVVIGQSWGHYTAAILITLWVKSGGRLHHVPFTIGKR